MHNDENYPREVYRYIGARLKQLRTERGLSQAQVGAVIGVSPQQYQKYEDASSKCSLVSLYALADHYRISVNEIIPLTENPVPAMLTLPEKEELPSDADLAARLIASFFGISDVRLKLHVVTIVEALARPGIQK